jgi:hypothetical protein
MESMGRNTSTSGQKRCKVLAKGAGLGNQIQFIPMIRELQNKYDVYTDSQTYEDLRICNVRNDYFPSVVYECYGHSLIQHLQNRIRYPFSKFYGFCHYIKQKRIAIGFTRYVDGGPYASTIGARHEFENMNQELVPTHHDLYRCLDGWEPVEDRIAILTSEKPEKKYFRWEEVINKLKGFDVRVYGDSDYLPGYVPTPTLLDFYEELRHCSYFFATDNGGMHLADALGIPGTVLFGRTSVKKNHPVSPNVRVIDFSTYPPELILAP